MKKKVWTKPVCERVKLEPAEACIGHCKKISNPTCLFGGKHAKGFSS
jgi:hypothetical protein